MQDEDMVNLDFFEKLFENYPDLVFIINAEGKFIKTSKGVMKYGVNNIDDLIGKNIFDFLKDEKKILVQQQLKYVLSNHFTKIERIEFETLNGNQYFGEITASLIGNESENSVLILVVIRDITKHVHLERELKENKKMFQLVIDNIPQYIFWKDIDSVYLGCNENFARVAGVEKPEHIIGKTDYDLAWKKSEAESFYEIDRVVMELNKPEFDVIEPQLQADGKEAWLKTNRIPLHDSKGEVIGLLGTYEDITKQLESRLALKESEKKYKTAFNRAEFYKDIFTHDIGNILQSIYSSVEICRICKDDPEKINELDILLKTIENETNRAARLINNIKKLSKIDSEEKLLKSIEIHQVIRNVVHELRIKYLHKKIIIIEEFIEKLNPVINANEYFEDAIYNIMLNSIKHNESKVIKIKIRTSLLTFHNHYKVKIEFIDNGIGMLDAQKEVLLESRNYKDKSIFKRTGIGLLLVKKIINYFDGEISIKNRIISDHSKGTNFTLIIPFKLNKDY
ncbi:MAG: PAS domain-containing protein [Candidatus Lokiarchaeota archaeon]|nr:PAS domain-containing protein [Candidatus Lokiarchaeota archaeon]MBD3199537.1 PAS domain-containing protein [Candidatus Lokiarchaeota archaeon]